MISLDLTYLYWQIPLREQDRQELCNYDRGFYEHFAALAEPLFYIVRKKRLSGFEVSNRRKLSLV